MQRAGVPIVVDNRSLSVVGVSEVLGQIRAIYGSWLKIKSHLLSRRPDLVILIDFPDFNMFLGRFAKKIGAKVLYYISPQIWAWRSGRVKTIKKLVDRMVVILPFEKAFYASHGMDVDYVGHPLIDILQSAPDSTRVQAAYRNFTGPLVGLLPGSRRSELKLMFDILMDSARIMLKTMPEIRFIIPVASSLSAGDIEARAARWGLPVQVVANDTYGVIKACDIILTVSGTVTLEAAILETPMVITNRVSKLSAEIGKRLIRTKYIGLPNLIADRDIAPELVQDMAQAPFLAEKAIELLKHPLLLDSQRVELRRIREKLGEPGISDRAARLVMETARGPI
jgi:lipid-A-disaccharide synthase